MQALFDAVNAICAKIQIVSNWFWDFPCNLDWYGSIPILGNFSLAIILLVGTGIYFTFRLHFVQVHNFIFAVKVLMQRNHTRNGISSLTAFLIRVFSIENAFYILLLNFSLCSNVAYVWGCLMILTTIGFYSKKYKYS